MTTRSGARGRRTFAVAVVGLAMAAAVALPAQAATAPDTVIDSAPAALTTSASATVTFHATVSGATFTCRRDGGAAARCTSPFSMTKLAAGAHTLVVTATASGLADPSPATVSWVVDLAAPSVPTGVSVTTDGASNTVSWTASTDDVAVGGYDVFRGGVLVGSVGAVTTYTDSAVTNGAIYGYTVRAKDTAGHVSAQSLTSSVKVLAPYDPHLTRAPYLTDLVGNHVAINFATDQSGGSASIVYGAVDGSGACTPTTAVASGRTTITVGPVTEYQWTSQVDVPASGTYCYRVRLGATDLLGSNGSPRFVTQVAFGASTPFAFDVFGDWGQVPASPGEATDLSNLMTQMAASGARFAVSVGDNGYPNGNQVDYGDLQQTSTSAIFSPRSWTVPGSTLPIFTAAGNHGLAGVTHADITTWTQSRVVSTSGGRYANDVYCCLNGSSSVNYGSEWYAFDVGNARFYVLDSAWGDLNAGTASPYANDALAHFAPGTPEYQWLLNDLQTHTPQLKFAFSHYPLYSDNPSQPSDTFLQGAANLEGMLGRNGVQVLFNGHAHIYQRNTASSAGMPITYITGGGGGTPEPVGPCVVTNDAYAIGWSPTTSTGSACGRGRAPTSASALYHFLKVSVNGTSVTVSPTDSTGRTFDVQTYAFKVPPDTYLDSTPTAGTTSASATFAFHASGSPATFACSLDGAAAKACTSPISYNGLAQAPHTFSVTATVSKSKDATPATFAWTVDSTPPSDPASLSATSSSPFQVDLAWPASSDNTGVTGYDVFRDGSLYASLGPVTSYSDTNVLGSSTHAYAVRARDVAGNVSGLVSAPAVTTAAPPVPIVADGFENGLGRWSPSVGLTVETATVHGGSQAVEGSTANGATYAKLALPGGPYADSYSRVWFDVVSGPSQVNLLRLRDAGGASLGYVYVETTGQLGFHDDATGVNTLSSVVPAPGWHALELHLQTGAAPGALGAVQVWLDNALVPDLSSTSIDVGSSPVAGLQIGEVQGGLTYDVAFDDVAFGTSRLGPVADSTPPSPPASVTADPTSPFATHVSWTAATDDVGVTSYTLLRDGAPLATLDGTTTSYDDTSVLASTTYSYTVVASDLAGNSSVPSAAATVTTPAAALPLFADGFESGGLGSWNSTSGLVVESAQVNSGSFAAEASSPTGVTFAKKTLPGGPYPDAYARVAFDVLAQGGQTTLLRLRDSATGSVGYVYLSPTGRLAFTGGPAVATVGLTSTVTPGPGWHALELHIVSAGASSLVEVWLDGVAVPGLTAPVDLGTAGPVSVLQIGDTSSSTGGWDIVYDDVAFSTSRLGPVGDVIAPTAPLVSAVASSPFQVDLTWVASADASGVVGYDVYRDGLLLASVGPTVTSWSDTGVQGATTHTYAVVARDASANVSAPGSSTVTTPAAAAPLWSDGFESGLVPPWTTVTGLLVQSTTVRSGAVAAESATPTGASFAKKSLGSTYPDAYAKVSFLVKSQAAQTTLLRLRDTPTGSGGYVYLSAGGNLAFRSDALSGGTVSTVGPGPGWHTVELHLRVGAAVGQNGVAEVWLDGVPVPALTNTSINVGASPIGVLQVGDTVSTSAGWDVVYDDAAFSTSRMGV